MYVNTIVAHIFASYYWWMGDEFENFFISHFFQYIDDEAVTTYSAVCNDTK